MALVSIGSGLHIGCAFGGGWPLRQAPAFSTIDAAGESVAFIGRVVLSSGPGTSKTLSTGKIGWWSTGFPTFASGSTIVRTGVQDVTSAGLEDGTWDVYGEVTGGSGAIGADGVTNVTMTSGSKTIAHGDLIAVVVEMTARGGTDTIRPGYTLSSVSSHPYVSIDTGSGPARSSGLGFMLITFDDGTLGYFDEMSVPATGAAVTFNSGSTPDEYALLFSLPFKASVTRLSAYLGQFDAGEDGELILYSDPLGTPVAERTATIDADEQGQQSTSAPAYVQATISAYTLERGTTYAVAYRPTTTGNRNILNRAIPDATWRSAAWLGTSLRGGTRTNQSGAFSASTTNLYALGAVITQIEDGGPSNTDIAAAVWAYANRQLS